MGAKLTSRLTAGAGDRDRKTRAAVERTVHDIESGAKQRARVDTGAMRAGIQGRMTSDHEGRVEALVEYTIYNEFGTRHMAAQPMLIPAAEAARESFVLAVREAWAS
jgi:HK97 gp10 family phage protein